MTAGGRAVGQARGRQHRDRRELPAGRRGGGRQRGSPARICAGRSAPRPSCARKWRAASRTIRCATASADAYLTEAHARQRAARRARLRARAGGGLRRRPASGQRSRHAQGRRRRPLSLDRALRARRRDLSAGSARDRARSASSSARSCAAMPTTTRSAPARGTSRTPGLPSGDTESQHAFVNGSVDLFKDLITLRASQDFALGGKNSSVDFPARSVLGLDYHWRAEHDVLRRVGARRTAITSMPT